MGNTATDVHAQLARVDMPVLVLRGEHREREEGVMDFSNSPTWPGLAAALPRGHDVYLPQYTHFIPMEDPDLIVEAVRHPERL